jgi:hypothetical protein
MRPVHTDKLMVAEQFIIVFKRAGSKHGGLLPQEKASVIHFTFAADDIICVEEVGAFSGIDG